jgi:hypothetical protein
VPSSETPEARLSSLKLQASKAESAYRIALARIESQKENVRTAAADLKSHGVSSVAEAEALVTQLTAEAEETLARAQEVLG